MTPEISPDATARGSRPMSSSIKLRRRLLGAVLVLPVVAAFGCGNGSSAQSKTGTARASVPGFPVELLNCGRTLRFDVPPQRLAALDQISVELLLHLDQGDAVVATANQSDPPFPTIAARFAALQRLNPSQNYPTAEALAAANPDFVIGNLELLSFSRAAGFGGPFTRDELAARQIASFALQCQGETASVELLFQRYLELGRILGRQAEAQRTIDEVSASLSATAVALAGAAPVRTLIYIDGLGPVQTLRTSLALAGGVNLIGANEGGCCPPAMPLEVIARRDPEAILISSFGALDPAAPTVAEKEAALGSLLPTTSAVRRKRYLAVDFIMFSTPQRLARDVRLIGRFLHPERPLPPP
jgi:iron complex transport system substrate-binding protein